MLSRDGAEHDRHRRPFARPFRLAATRERLEAFVHDEAARLADGIAQRGGGDLRLDLAAPLSARVMLVALGLESVDEDEVLGWYAEIVESVSGLNLGREPTPGTGAAVQQLEAAVIAAAAHPPHRRSCATPARMRPESRRRRSPPTPPCCCSAASKPPRARSRSCSTSCLPCPTSSPR